LHLEPLRPDNLNASCFIHDCVRTH
jgi:hypothetical protein